MNRQQHTTNKKRKRSRFRTKLIRTGIICTMSYRWNSIYDYIS